MKKQKNDIVYANRNHIIEKKTRDKAIRSLRKFLSTGNSLSDMELFKLWKGLFYCKTPFFFVVCQ